MIYIRFRKKPLEFIDLCLYPLKTSFYSWKFYKFVLHPLETPRPKIQDLWKIDMTFSSSPLENTLLFQLILKFLHAFFNTL